VEIAGCCPADFAETANDKPIMEEQKKWTKKTLRKEDWDFSALAKLPKTAINRVFLWELDRELGSGQGPFTSKAENRAYLAAARKSDPAIEESGKATKGDKLSTIHSFRVNWAATKPDLIREFTAWVDKNSTPFTVFPSKTRGRPRNQFTLLEKISIHRFQQAGYSGGPKFFREEATDNYRKNLQRINWTLVKRELTGVIAARKAELKAIERRSGKKWAKVLY
tara:strand:- start:5999 stop:6667 length:669 start_codon:yes stop_codon:yes gene_type:complete